MLYYTPLTDKKHNNLRGAGSNTPNPYLSNRLVQEHPEGLDEEMDDVSRLTKVHIEFPKTVVNKVDSPDVPLNWSLNPYQGCEHGCVYCYARNSHTYWGFSAGLDFEQQIVAKPHAPNLLKIYLNRKNYKPEAISLSGNTDCYQPLERKMKITRELLEIFLDYRHPVGIITKNSLILRDLDLLKQLAALGLVNVMISITTLNEDLRRNMEPRTATAKRRLETVRELAEAGVPVGVMMAPIIPGLNSHEIPQLLEAAAGAGALEAGYTMLRLNGQVAELFEEWIRRVYPLKADKVLHQVAAVHGGKLNDSRFGKRMRGDGPVAESIQQLFKLHRKTIFGESKMPELRTDIFIRPDEDTQIKLF